MFCTMVATVVDHNLILKILICVNFNNWGCKVSSLHKIAKDQKS